MNRQLTMLIVDDMEVERISFAEIFKDEYQILEAENGKQAMEQPRKNAKASSFMPVAKFLKFFFYNIFYLILNFMSTRTSRNFEKKG